MLKLLICLMVAAVLSAGVLLLRQQRLELEYQRTSLFGKIEKAQIKLWNQQLQIATYTTPNAIENTVKQYDLTLVPSKPFMPVPDEGLQSDVGE